MSKATLLIMAAGLGSRYNGKKQIDPVSENNEFLLEFALYDAIKAGFTKFVFIINAQFPDAQKQKLYTILNTKNCEAHFVIQTVSTYVPKKYFSLIQQREKPWGTAHAVYCAKQIINEPFVTINADDYYGFQAFDYAFKSIKRSEISSKKFAMVAFMLENTLSNNGSVSRGICKIENNHLLQVEEFFLIKKNSNIIQGINEKNQRQNLKASDFVSMNFWILHPEYFKMAERFFNVFFENSKNILSDEFYLPSVIDNAINQHLASVMVIPTSESWFGLTYKNDKDDVVNQIRNKKAQGLYPEKLWV